MSKTSSPERNEGFRDYLRRLEPDHPRWPVIWSGWSTLRLVDRWIGHREAADTGADAVRRVLSLVSSTDPALGALAGVLDGLRAEAGGAQGAVGARLLAYAMLLRAEAAWGLTLDVVERVVALSRLQRDPVLAADAWLLAGFCRRQQGRWEESAQAYRTAREVATAGGQGAKALLTQIGEAKIQLERGNLVEAAREFERIAGVAEVAGWADVQSRALHDRMAVASYQECWDEGIAWGYRAMARTVDVGERERLLGDLASAFLATGRLDTAATANRVLAATAVQAETRMAAVGNLMTLAAIQGDAAGFDEAAGRIQASALSATIEGQFAFDRAVGLRRLGRLDEAREALFGAERLAQRYELTHLETLIEAEQEVLHRTPHILATHAQQDPDWAEAVHEAATWIQDQASAAGV